MRRPDYGLMVARSGHGNVLQLFYAVPLSHLSVGGPDLFTSLVNKVHAGVEYAVSLDFGPTEAAAVLKKASAATGRRLEVEASGAEPGDTIDFGQSVPYDIEARLGRPEVGTSGEQFVPLVVRRVA